jgi:hypothetical protein
MMPSSYLIEDTTELCDAIYLHSNLNIDASNLSISAVEPVSFLSTREYEMISRISI